MKSFVIALLLVASQGALAFTLTSGNPTQSGWAQRPLKIYVNRTNCPADLDTFINQSIELWNSAVDSSLKLELGPDSTNTQADLRGGTATDVPLVICDDNFTANQSVDGDSIPGVGFVNSVSVAPITSGGLILNVESGKAGDINQLPAVSVAVVVAHEIGHMLGIGHSSDTRSLMYYDASFKQHLSLSQDDLDAVAFLYPRNELSKLSLIGGCGSIAAVGGDSSDQGFWGGNSLGFLSLGFLLYLALMRLRNSASLKLRARA